MINFLLLVHLLFLFCFYKSYDIIICNKFASTIYVHLGLHP